MRTMSKPAATIAVTFALLLSGCGPLGGAAPDSTSVPAPTASALAPTVESIDPFNASSWTISTAGVGPVEIGQNLQDARAALSHFSEQPADSCPNPRVKVFTLSDAQTLWLVLDEEGAEVVGLRLSDYEGGLGNPVGPRTIEGVGVGTTVDAMWAAYPDLLTDSASGVALFSSVAPSGVWLTFSPHLGEDQSLIRTVDVYPGKLFYELCGS